MKIFVLICCVASLAASVIADTVTNLPTVRFGRATKLTLLGITHGSYQAAPNYDALGRSIPRGTWIDTGRDTPVVWIEMEHPDEVWHGLHLLVYDEANTGCVPAWPAGTAHVKNFVDVLGFPLYAFPRGTQNVILRVEQRQFGEGHISKDKFVIPNPGTETFPMWPAEMLPSRKSDGNLAVTLQDFIGDAPIPDYIHHASADANDPLNKCVRISYDLQQTGGSDPFWWPIGVKISDAAGDHLHGPLDRYSRDDPDAGYYFRTPLWADGRTWKVHLEFARSSGFADDEIITLKNVPVRLGNQTDLDNQSAGKTTDEIAEDTADGIHMKILQPVLSSDVDGAGERRLRVLVRADTNSYLMGFNLQLIKATDDQNNEIRFPFAPFDPGPPQDFAFEFVTARVIKTMNLSFAVNQKRVVEFIVKPSR